MQGLIYRVMVPKVWNLPFSVVLCDQKMHFNAEMGSLFCWDWSFIGGKLQLSQGEMPLLHFGCKNHKIPFTALNNPVPKFQLHRNYFNQVNCDRSIYIYFYFIFLREANSPAGTFLPARSAELGFFFFFGKAVVIGFIMYLLTVFSLLLLLSWTGNLHFRGIQH